jgi:exodeoxyribonuclease-5
LSLPQIIALRPTLVPEFPVYASEFLEDVEQVTIGVTDATSFSSDGMPRVVVDWKSDVDPTPETVKHYQAQVRSYLRTIGVENGLIVFVTSGTTVPVKAPIGNERIC